ncbi:MAG: general secretion pathway protein GspK, partial [Spirochaetia bacterium]|nr:general secretion pathway protein GspK [Spirochaetia bacterium]
MKTLFNKKYHKRKGAMAILFVISLGFVSFIIALQFLKESRIKYGLARTTADGFKAKLIAQAGLQAAISAVQTVPEEFLFQSGYTHNPPDILLENCKPKCFISYRIQPENGKINLNDLLRADGRPSLETRQILERFFVHYNIPVQTVDSIIDWIDEDNSIEGAGAESEFYKTLKPPRKIKNYYLFSLSELCAVRGLSYPILYHSHMPEGWLELQEELSFKTDVEKEMITEADWIPANHLTAYVDQTSLGFQKININAARYHVLLSLSDSMTPEAVKEIITLRRKRDNYISKVSELSDLPELQVSTPDGKSLYEELAGSAGELSGLITTKGKIYRITGIGSIIMDSDNNKAVVRSMSVL